MSETPPRLRKMEGRPGKWTYGVQWRTEDGRKVTKRFGSKLAAARAAHREWLKGWLDDPSVRSPGRVRMSCRQAWAAFEEYGRERFQQADGTVGKRLTNIRHAIEGVLAVFAEKPAGDLTARDLEEVRRGWVEAGMTRVTVNNRVNDVRRVWKWLVGRGHVSATVLEGLKALEPLERGRAGATEGEGVKPVSEEWVFAVAAIVPPTLRAMIEVHWATGMRPGELVQMTLGDIERGGEVWIYRPGKHKNAWRGKAREVLLGPNAQRALTPYLNRGPSDPVFSPRRAMEERGRSGGGESYTTMSYARAISRACVDADVPHWSPNQIRHAVGTRARENGGLDVAQVVLGHATVDATQVYAEANRPKAIEYALRFG